MVSSVTSLSQSVPVTSSPASETRGQKVDLSLRREIAVTAKFGPDPFTGSPLQIISGNDVQAAENNDLLRLAQANISPVSPSNSFQAQSAGSSEIPTVNKEASRSGQAAQQNGTLSQSSLNFGVGLGGGQRGVSVDFEV